MIVFAALAVLAGCASAVPSTPTLPSPAAPSYHYTYPSVDLDFTARTVDGERLSGSSLVGKP